MTGAGTRYLYVTRHGEATADESGLSENGRRQADLLGRRLRNVPLARVHHGPLPRAEQTARRIADQLDGVPVHSAEAAGDYPPYLPARDELPPDSAALLGRFLDGLSRRERERGPELAREALDRFTGPADGEAPRHELLVTHNFLAGWIVRAAQDAPNWRWLGLNHANAALTVVRYTPGRPSALLVFNDMSHLPDELRWTGIPPELRV